MTYYKSVKLAGLTIVFNTVAQPKVNIYPEKELVTVICPFCGTEEEVTRGIHMCTKCLTKMFIKP